MASINMVTVLSSSLLLVAISVCSGQHTITGCRTGTGVIREELKPAYTMEIAPNCTKGGFDWNYPEGQINLTLRLQTGGDFNLCITAARFFGVVNMSYVRDDGSEERLQFAKDYNDQIPLCRPSTGGIVQFVLRGPEKMETYMGIVEWKVDPYNKPFSGCRASTVGSTLAEVQRAYSLEIPSHCAVGGFDWPYPQGQINLTLRLQEGGDFNLCITAARYFFYDIYMTYLRDDGSEERLLFAENDNDQIPVCRPSTQGTIKFVLRGPAQIQTYLATIDWRVDPYDEQYSETATAQQNVFGILSSLALVITVLHYLYIT